MSVYFVVQEKVTDEEGMKAYGKASGSTLAGKGKPLAVDNNVTPIEGEWHGARVVILEFEDEAAFRAWYDSPEYQAALPLRLAATDSRGVLVQGLPPRK
ncbi:MAG: DUF1330 domain-containing protein [Chloroflexi bacterium]|nr:DUF1330 domain-containing protein [Chloroflexota bacterium]MDA1145333.1 DUF1330 domain-containing protein [Chloroflexota bacterium]